MWRLVRVAVVFVVAGAVGVWWLWQEREQERETAIRGSGIVEATEVDVAFEVPGTIIARFVDEGAMVDKGEPIAQLDEREFRLQVERAQAAKAAAEARYALLTRGARGQEVDQALAALESAEAELRMRERDFTRVDELFRQGIAAQAEWDRVRAALNAAQAARDAARARLDMLKEGFRTEEIEEGRARLREAEKALAIAELNLARCQLYAPIAGRVLSRNREVGETVMAGTPIVTMGDLSRPWVNLYVSERDLGRVRLGMRAMVYVDAYPNRPFEGKVVYVSDKSEFTPKNIQTQNERVKLVYRVKIEVENPEGILKPGMPADAVIPLDQVEQHASPR
ncbi:MAG: efflux RND transporter periplasmic adaptor subunit [Candidatus Binatia bacterium]|nr:efflux RND transporter periplasmic adaptor subunit [Candidatus Binatia bacterium]